MAKMNYTHAGLYFVTANVQYFSLMVNIAYLHICRGENGLKYIKTDKYVGSRTRYFTNISVTYMPATQSIDSEEVI